jgi:hypothetical protein
MEQLLPLIIQLIGGAAGGNIVGALLKNIDLSKVVATVVGLIGGVAGGQLAGLSGILEQIFGATAEGGQLVGHGASSAIGGAILTAIVGFIKKAMAGQRVA